MRLTFMDHSKIIRLIDFLTKTTINKQNNDFILSTINKKFSNIAFIDFKQLDSNLDYLHKFSEILYEIIKQDNILIFKALNLLNLDCGRHVIFGMEKAKSYWLFKSTRLGSNKILNYLIKEKYCDISSVNDYSETCVFNCLKYSTMKILIKNNIDFSIKNYAGHTFFDYLLIQNTTKSKKILIYTKKLILEEKIKNQHNFLKKSITNKPSPPKDKIHI